MTLIYLMITCFLFLTLMAGMWRILRGPTAADRMLAAQLFGTTAVAILLILAQLAEQPAFRDAALLLALLATVTVVAFVHRAWQTISESEDESS
ncbi:monovalent cation/H+ antiporter complex subunit F [Nitrosomonas halophila]|uniref:Multicomponent Na+:H+ antiporter subunit F n=1 Tax=Nitrosomonas halophila TaxID=44576 RepID=A0A1H3HAC2_9PROT|nr:monovalent cation/H+ antiporter complex subunit F [Nitrosomonas halophila]SDY12432.1 multicomponent Na+:H+ antiporter subunit F [Nitrosomonas halophila]HRQ04429.1 monovalent cation/H+ antiporter complex subunit F [Nitrosomonas halophila]